MQHEDKLDELFNNPVGSSGTMGDTGSEGFIIPVPNGLDAKSRLELTRFAHKASVALAYTVAVLAVAFDFWAQVNTKPYQLHDWIVGLILIPLGGAGMELFKEWLKRRK